MKKPSGSQLESLSKKGKIAENGKLVRKPENGKWEMEMPKSIGTL